MPTPSVVRRLLRTYTCEAALSPTSTTASPGTRLPSLARRATAAWTSAVTVAATAFPSISLAVIVSRAKRQRRPSPCAGRRTRASGFLVGERRPPIDPVAAGQPARFPTGVARVRGEHRVRIDRDRARRVRQQGEVVDRIGVNPHVAEVRQALALRRQPVEQPLHLA